MLLLACLYKRRYNKGVRIVYEVADLHRMLVDEQIGIMRIAFAKCVAFFECRCSCLVDKLILTSERYYDVYYNQLYSKEQVLFIPNAPSLKVFADYVPKNHNIDFTVGFIGGIRYPNEIKMLISAAKQAGVRVFLAGMETGDEIRKLCENENHVEYFGGYDYDTQIAKLYGRCDAIYSVYPANMKNVKVALPNKLYESMLCGLPLIVSEGTYVGELVTTWGIGIAVKYNSLDELANALEILSSDKEVYSGFVNACEEKEDIATAERCAEQYALLLESLCGAVSR